MASEDASLGTVSSDRVESASAAKRIWGLTTNVFVLGLVSFLTDISSEITLTLLPLYLANVLRVPTSIIGVIEGVAESAASLLKIGSGYLSDRLGRRKLLTGLGYGLSALSKPLLYFAAGWELVLGIRFTDRLGKGIRTSPRDALLAASTPAAERGRSFGFHRAADTGGAVLGLGLASLIVYLVEQQSLLLTEATYRTMVLVGIIPGLVAALLVPLFITEEGPRPSPSSGQRVVGHSSPARRLGRPFAYFLGVMVIFTLGNSSDAFLILRAQTLGMPVFQISLLLVMFNVLYTVVAMPAGILSDRLGRRRIIILGWVIYALVYLGFALAGEAWQVGLLYVLYGLYYGTAEGVGRALVADLVAAERRGTAYGLYHGAIGLAAFPASFVAGLLWQLYGPAAPFYLGAGLAGLAAVGLVALVREK